MSYNIKIIGLLILFIGIIFLTSCNTNSSNYKNPNPPVTNEPINPLGQGPAPVNLSSNGGVLNPSDLGSAGNYVILTKAGITNVTGSSVVGNLGVSPVAATYITGFSLVADPSNVFSTSSSVTGKIYASDYSPPTPSNLTTAIGSMETAYGDAASRTSPNYTELATGNLGGLTLVPGLYKWSSSVIIPSNVTLSGGANDVWIFQIAGNLTMDSAMQVILSGGAVSKNVFWQVAGQVFMGTNSHFEGIMLCKTSVTLGTQSSIRGRIFSQTMVALDNNVVTESQ